MKSADISEILDELDKEQAVILFRLLSKEKAGMAFSYMENRYERKTNKRLDRYRVKKHIR